jgi:predicted GIY-YIG superfamily endonuclease
MPTHFIYILYFAQTDKYYIGQTEDIERRLIDRT